MYDQPKNWKFRIILLAIVLVATAFFFGDPLRKLWMSQAFAEAELASFQRLADAYDDVTPDSTIPPRTGKVLLVIPETWSIYREGPRYITRIPDEIASKKVERVGTVRLDDDWYRLDSSVRAASPDEVDTVVICEYGTVTVGHYVSEGSPNGRPTAGSAAKRRKVLLRVYDRHSGELLGCHEVLGPANKQRIDAWESKMAAKPDLVRFVEQMPLR